MIKEDVGALMAEKNEGEEGSFFFLDKNEVQEFEGMTHEC